MPQAGGAYPAAGRNSGAWTLLSEGRSAAVGRKVGCSLATDPLSLCLPGCPQGGCMSRWAKGERRCLSMVGVGKPAATGTGTRVGVACIVAEWLGWCDTVLKYLGCTGAIPSHTCADGAPSARRYGCQGCRDMRVHAPQVTPQTRRLSTRPALRFGPQDTRCAGAGVSRYVPN